MIKTQPPISQIRLKGREIYILRDDLLGEKYPPEHVLHELNGNKARKLEWLLDADFDDEKSMQILRESGNLINENIFYKSIDAIEQISSKKFKKNRKKHQIFKNKTLLKFNHKNIKIIANNAKIYNIADPKSKITHTLSYGSAQSNAMLALSLFAKFRKLNFIYFAHNIPPNLRENPYGNYKIALQNNAQIFTSNDPRKSALKWALNYNKAQKRGLANKIFKSFYIRFLSRNFSIKFKFAPSKIALRIFIKQKKSQAKQNAQNHLNFSTNPRKKNNFKALFIDEGVASPVAFMGYETQARQIAKFLQEIGEKFDIFLPSGTGTSAAFLAINLNLYGDFRVYTCPCVGDESYLRAQISSLLSSLSKTNFIENLLSNLPARDQILNFPSNLIILNPPKKFPFAKPQPQLAQMYKELEKTGIKFDLIYDPVGFITLFHHEKCFKNQILYIHQGGITGNISQLMRYKFKKLIV